MMMAMLMKLCMVGGRKEENPTFLMSQPRGKRWRRTGKGRGQTLEGKL